jgi:hypothetical protein
MLLIGIGTILILVLCISSIEVLDHIESTHWRWKRTPWWFIGLCVIWLIILLAGWGWGTITIIDRHTVKYERQVNIYAGHNSLETQGQFFLLTGYANDVDTVYYWVKDDSGTLRKYNISMSKSVFIEDGGQYVVFRGIKCDNYPLFCLIENVVEEAEFHVPEGSVISIFQYQ